MATAVGSSPAADGTGRGVGSGIVYVEYKVSWSSKYIGICASGLEDNGLWVSGGKIVGVVDLDAEVLDVILWSENKR